MASRIGPFLMKISSALWPDSFRLRLSILFGGLFLLASLLDGVSLNQKLYDRLLQDKGEDMHAMARSIAKAIASNLDERQREVVLLAQSPTFARAPLDGPDLRGALERVKRAYRYYAWVGVAAPGGRIVSASGGMLEGQSAAQRPWFIHGQAAPFIGDIHKAVLLAKLLHSPAAGGEPLRFVDFAAPIRDDAGHLRGVLATHTQWGWVQDTIADRLPRNAAKDGLQVFIVDRDNALLSPFEAIGKVQPPPLQEQTFRLSSWPDGESYLYADAPVTHNGRAPLGWRVIVRQPRDRALLVFNQFRAALALPELLLTLLLMIVVYQLAAAFSRPLEALAGIAQRIGQGDEHATWTLKTGTRELRQLSDAMQGMTASLLAQRRELAASNADLEKKVEERTEELRETNRLLAHKATQLERLARSDALTGLNNRMAAEERLSEEHQRFLRSGAPYAALLMDADHFKRVNDSHGHAVGDQVLQQIAATLQAALRATDFAARYGGEEFLALLPDTDADGAVVLAEKIRAAMAASSTTAAGAVTLSIGVAAALPDDASHEAIVQRADAALYRAKAQGRNRVERA